MNRFCVKCGKATDKLIESLCVECFSKERKVLELPSEIVVDFDIRSGRVRIEGKWVEESAQVFHEMVESKVLRLAKHKRVELHDLKVELVDVEELSMNAKVSFAVDFSGVKAEFAQVILVRKRKTISDASMKLSSNYHEAIIQLRFKEKPDPEFQKEKLVEVVKLLKEEKKKIELSEAVDIKKVRGGVDLYIGSSKAAKVVTRNFARSNNSKVIYSNKLLGIDIHGKTKYRHTFCVKV